MGNIKNVCCHSTLLTFEIIFAIPAVVLFSNNDSLYSGVAYFTVVCIVAAFGFLFVCLECLFQRCCLTRWLFNMFLFFYVIAQLGVCAWAAFYAYVFSYPFAGFPGGWKAYWATHRVDFFDVSDSSSFVKGWYITGIVVSIFLSIISLLVCWTTYKIMTNHGKKQDKKEKKKERHDEEQPLLYEESPQPPLVTADVVQN